MSGRLARAHEASARTVAGMAVTNPDPTKRLTQEQKDRIVELRLIGTHVHDVADEVGCAVSSVVRIHKKWLSDPDNHEALARQLALLDVAIADYHEISAKAKAAISEALAAGKYTSAAMLMGELRQARTTALKVTGADVPQRIEHSGGVTIDLSTLSDDELQALITGD